MSTLTETIQAYKSGAMTRPEFVDDLSTRTYKDPPRATGAKPGSNAWYDAIESDPYNTPGTFDEVNAAHNAGLISDEDFTAIVAAINRRRRPAS